MTDPISLEYLEKRLLDQREEMTNQIILIHQGMREDKKDFFDALSVTNGHIQKISVNMEKLATEQTIRLDQHSDRLGKVEGKVDSNTESRIKSDLKWALAGVMSTSLLGAAVKLLFFPAP